MSEENGRIFNVKGKIKVSTETLQDLSEPTPIPLQFSETFEPCIENGNGDNGENIPSGYQPADKIFWLLALEKIVENFLSVKVWTIFVFLWVSAYLCYTGHMSGADFATSNGSIISVVYALRESFKTIKIRQAKNMEDIKKMKV